MLKVSVSGIRGIWGDSLTHEVIINYVKAYVACLGKNKKIALGSDTRKTRNVIRHLILGILESYGYEVLDLGIVPTPLVLYAVKEKGLDGGIVISASHNPAPWNALKLVKKGGFFLNQAEVENLKFIYEKRQFLSYESREMGKTVSYDGILKEYLEKVESLIDCHVIRQKNFKVVADTVNGTANVFAHSLFYFLNAEHQILFTDMDQEFERGAEPLPENLTHLSQVVIQSGADLGLAYDPDADRLALVDEKGQAVGEDWTLAVAYLNLLEKEKTSIVVNLSTSMIVDEIARREKTEVFKAKVGEINVTEAMLERKLLIGGEGNGGVIYFPVNHCRDSLIATLMVMEYLARSGKTLSQVVAEFPRIIILKEKIPVTGALNIVKFKSAVQQALESKKLQIKEIDESDGVRVDYEGGWIQIRASNTEPVVRIMGENTDSEMNRWLAKILKQAAE